MAIMKNESRPAKRAPRTAANDATLAFIAELTPCQTLARALADHLDDHAGYDPDNLNWGHVGDIQRTRHQLREICTMLGVDIPGETSPQR
ncbi:hypothetical protein DB346_08220 [Verrucomicrobia bacterium LW23]|nr:hypothetical protein DB346_08220 [Verrucomicrobia bacterium LW23]